MVTLHDGKTIQNLEKRLFLVRYNFFLIFCSDQFLRMFFFGVQEQNYILRILKFKTLILFAICGKYRWPTSASDFVFKFTIFYLPHMEYEGSIGLVSRKMKKNYC
jgi:hypothetical protein